MQLLETYPSGVSGPIIASEIECRLRDAAFAQRTGGLQHAYDRGSASVLDTVARTGHVGLEDVLEVWIQAIVQLPQAPTRLARLWDGHSRGCIDMYVHSSWDRYNPEQFPFIPMLTEYQALAADAPLVHTPWMWRIVGARLSATSGEPRLLPTSTCVPVLDLDVAQLRRPAAAAAAAGRLLPSGHRGQAQLRYLRDNHMLDDTLENIINRLVTAGAGAAMLVSVMVRVVSRGDGDVPETPIPDSTAGTLPSTQLVVVLRDLETVCVARLHLLGGQMPLGRTFTKGDALGLQAVEAELGLEGDVLLFLLPDSCVFVLPRSRSQHDFTDTAARPSPAKPRARSPLRPGGSAEQQPPQLLLMLGNIMTASAVEAYRDEYGVVDGDAVADRLLIAGLAPRMKNVTLAGYIVSVSANQPKVVAGIPLARVCLRVIDESNTECDVTAWAQAAKTSLRLRPGQMVLLQGLRTSLRSAAGTVYISCVPHNGGCVGCLSTMPSWPSSRTLCRAQILTSARTQRSAVVRAVVLDARATDGAGMPTMVHSECLLAPSAAAPDTCRACGGPATPLVACYALTLTLDDGVDAITAALAPTAAEDALRLSIGDWVQCSAERQQGLLRRLVGTEIVCVIAALSRGRFRIDALATVSHVPELQNRLAAAAIRRASAEVVGALSAAGAMPTAPKRTAKPSESGSQLILAKHCKLDTTGTRYH